MSSLPDYVSAAKPNPLDQRAPWYKNTAPTYAGIMLWFVFWQDIPMIQSLIPGSPVSTFAGGSLSQGLGVALIGLLLAAMLCHFLFYLVPGLLGMKTGLPLYIVGTSTYGVLGGLLMPGFLMGVLQYGWLAVNAYFAGILLCAPFGYGPNTVPHAIVASVWAIAAAFLGIKGIQYVAKVSTYLPLIPLVILIVLAASTFGGLEKFDAQAMNQASLQAEHLLPDAKTVVQAGEPLSIYGVIAALCVYIVGFFATAGAAGCDFGMNNRDAKDVQLGGLVGVAGATIFAGGLSLLIVAGAYGLGKVTTTGSMQTTALMGDIMSVDIMGISTSKIMMYLLAISAFPSACFSSLIAANSFKVTMPKVNPLISCGIGTLVAILLAVSGWAGNAAGVFVIIGASFGPVCGAMVADYLLAGRSWAGPRAGFNLAGWLSWIVGFSVGAYNMVAPLIPALADYQNLIPIPPVSAFIVGFIVYAILAKLGLESKKVDAPNLAL